MLQDKENRTDEVRGDCATLFYSETCLQDHAPVYKDDLLVDHYISMLVQIDHLSCTNAPLYEDHLSKEATVGGAIGHLGYTNAPLYKDHLCKEATVGGPIGHPGYTNAPLYEDHLCIETTVD